MNTFSVDDLTRTSSRSLSTIPSRLECDKDFERRLPPEILAELEEETPPQTYRLREVAPAYLRPPPPRLRECEESLKSKESTGDDSFSCATDRLQSPVTTASTLATGGRASFPPTSSRQADAERVHPRY
jgi:hypothetical protein